MASGNATVKAVLSGDTLVLVGKASAGPPPELTITLSFVHCPKIARGPSQEDEPFAWASREFLRELCVGKSVSFKVTQTVMSINRTFGEVTLNGVPLVKMVVENGWANLKELRDRDSNPESDALYDDLVALHATAKANKLGMFTDDAEAKKKSVRKIDWTTDATKYFESLTNGKKTITPTSPAIINSVIEHVRDGASFRCFVPKDSCYVTFALAGATCPRVNASSSSSNENSNSDAASPEPFALQSKLFSECRLLNRRLDLAVQGITSGRGESMLLGTVLHPRGNITVEIVKAGLAKVADWTLAMLPKDGVVTVREAENCAKREHRGIWAGYVAPPPPPCCRVFEAVVVEVLSGDTIMVLEGNSERRITFSSIRVPRQQAKGANSDPFAVECKEFVRQKLIGKTVSVSLEYQRGEGKDLRQFATVRYGSSPARGQDIAFQLVQEGLAVTVRHRGDEPRAAGYDMLLVEEVQAVAKKKGMHGPQSRASAAGAVQDVSSDSKKAKALFATLSADKTYRGVIEHVFTASRFKVHIPSENITLQLALAQVRPPMVPKDSKEGERAEGVEEGEVPEHPLAKWVEAGKRFSRHSFLQRKVELDLLDIDRNGILLGKASIGGEALTMPLVRQGFVSVDKFAQRRGGGEVTRLLELQEEAKLEKRGMWVVPNAVGEVKEGEEEVDGEESGEDFTKNMFRVNLTEIYNGASFAVNFVEQPNESDSPILRGQMKLAEMEEMMRAFAKDVSTNESQALSAAEVTKGALLAVLHENPSAPQNEETVENVWLRGIVEEKLGEGQVKVQFVDYGHRATVAVTVLKSLPEPLKHYAAQAVPCSLSFLRADAVGTNSGVAAARALNSLAWGKSCLVKVHSRERPSSSSKSSEAKAKASIIPPKLDVSLYAVESFSEEDLKHATNVGVKLVRHGFLRISATLARKVRGGQKMGRRGQKTVPRAETSNETLNELEVAQDLAHKEHLRIWAYGHPGDSDDEDIVPVKDENPKK